MAPFVTRPNGATANMIFNWQSDSRLIDDGEAPEFQPAKTNVAVDIPVMLGEQAARPIVRRLRPNGYD